VRVGGAYGRAMRRAYANLIPGLSETDSANTIVVITEQ